MVSFIIGVAINTEEYVPTNTPIINANNNPLSESAPNKNIANNTTNVVKEVFNVLLKVLFKAVLTVRSNYQLVCSFKNSLILSNTTTVSLREYPITVSIAAINAWSTSILKGINLQVIEKIPNTINTSWNTAATAPSENCHFLNRNKIYKKTTTNDPKIAQTEDFFISSAIVGLTLLEYIFPTLFEPSIKSS